MQDFTQEAYTRAWQRWKRLQSYDNPESWLRLVVTRLATDRWRWLGVRRAAPQLHAHPVPGPNETLTDLIAELKRLPMDQRRALVLHYFLDRPVAEIAAETGTNINTVKSWLSRGRERLAVQLTEMPSLPEAETVQENGRKRRRNTLVKTIAAFFATATAAAVAVWLTPQPAPLPSAPDVVVPFASAPRFSIMAASGNHSYAMWMTGDEHEWIAAIDMTSRQPAWEPVDLGIFGDSNGMEVTANALIMLTEQGAAFKSDTIVAIDPQTGKTMWTLPYSFNDTTRATFDSTLVINFSESGQTDALDLRTGKPRWSLKEPLTLRGVTAMRARGEFSSFTGFGGTGPAKGQQVVLLLADGRAQVRDVASGTVLSERQTGITQTDGNLVAFDDTLYSVAENGITIVALTGQAPVRHLPITLGRTGGEAIPCGKDLLCVPTETGLIAVNLQSGQEAFRATGPQGGGYLSVSDSGILLSSMEGTVLLSPTGQPILPGKLDGRMAMWLDHDHLLTFKITRVDLGELSPGVVVPEVVPKIQIAKVSVADDRETPLPMEPSMPYCSWDAKTLACPTAEGIAVISY